MPVFVGGHRCAKQPGMLPRSQGGLETGPALFARCGDGRYAKEVELATSGMFPDSRPSWNAQRTAGLSPFYRMLRNA